MKVALTISLLSLILCACAKENQLETTKNSLDNDAEISATMQPETLVFDVTCIGSHQQPEEQLTSRFIHLEDLPHNYQIISYGIHLDAPTLQNSIFYGLQKHISTLENVPELNITGFDNLMSQVQMNNYAWVKDTVSLGGDVYPRATIEEYVFSSKECAHAGARYLNWLTRTGHGLVFIKRQVLSYKTVIAYITLLEMAHI